MRALLAACLLLGCAAVQADIAAASAGVARLRVQRIEFSGNSVISTATLRAVARDYLERPLEDADLQALLRNLTDLYLQAGYSTSRAVLPDQDVASGVLRVAIVEGFLERIVVSGTRALDPSYIAERLQAGLTTPLNVAVLNANLRLLNQEPSIASLRGELVPGSRPGAAVLRAVVEEAGQYQGGIRLANDRAPAVGGLRGAIEGSAYNLLGRGDEFDLTIGTADGLTDLDFRVTSPINHHGSAITLRYFRAVSELVEEQFSVLGAETHSRALDVGLTQALWRRGSRQIGLALNFVSKQSESTLQGVPFSFSPGVENGHADVKVARLGLTWQERQPHDLVTLRVTLSRGLGVLGATEHEDGAPDSRFTSVFGQLQWLHLLGPRLGSVYARADTQQVSDGLLPLEKFAVGGTYSVRGYRRSRFVRDNGWSATLEYRLPLFKLPVPGVSQRESDGQLALIAFADAGRAWNDDDAADSARTLLAAGPGLRWDVRASIRAELYWGGLRRHLADSGERGDDLQDHGVHFVLSARQSF